MKPRLHSTVLLISTSVLLLAPLSGLCFYNPATGRWLNRDPIEEAGGPNLHGFVANRPTDLRDPLGRDFNWDTPRMEHWPHPFTNYYSAGYTVKFGGTAWWYFRPHAPEFKHPDCPSCKPYRISVYGSASAWSWYTTDESFRHERAHILSDYYPAYLGFKQDAESYQHICMSKAKADCLANVILGVMREFYMQQGRASGKTSDWLYAGSPASSLEYNEMMLALYLLQMDFQAYINAVFRCSSIPE
jgi:hypothetical protein